MDKTGDTTTPLGGRKYATASIEAGREVYAFDAGSVFVSAFWDAGSVWDLPTTQGGFGAIDDSAHLRQSAGLAVDVETRYGILSLAYAEPLQRRPDDRLQALSVAFRLGF